ncbi:PepSY domain-containing protein [Nocardioides malaquae]|uniref:PepSY domain-containing protein n=1 Tax=Nocardioides malaquae TaxID=2773426 RepID=UPI001D0CE6B8|nr:PepSY domain-containing protein [Nocardioides malaquae]
MAHARPSMPLRAKGVALAAVAALALAGCGDDAADDLPNPASPGESAPSSVDAETAAELAEALVAAGRTAEAEVDGSRVVGLEADTGEWEATVVDNDGVEHEMRISADGSEVTREPQEDDTDKDDREANLAELGAAQLDVEQAVDALAVQAGDQRIVDLQLDDDGGTVVWEAELEDGSEVRIDAGTADVVN